MKPGQFLCYTMLQTTAITSIVSTRVIDGPIPQSTVLSALPAINVTEQPGGNERNGIGEKTFTINSRALTKNASEDLSREIIKLFNGLSGSGKYGSMNGFDIARISLRDNGIGGLIYEDSTGYFNYPVDIFLVYSLDTVS
jgi:hypothetical protein